MSDRRWYRSRGRGEGNRRPGVRPSATLRVGLRASVSLEGDSSLKARSRVRSAVRRLSRAA